MDENKIQILKRTHSALVLGVSALVHVPLIVCVALLLVIVVPSFEGMFRTLGAELPWVTQVVLSLGMNVRQNWPLWMCLVPVVFILDAAAVAALVRYVGGFWAWLYSFFVAVVIAAVGLLIFLSMYLPLFKTASAISA